MCVSATPDLYMHAVSELAAEPLDAALDTVCSFPFEGGLDAALVAEDDDCIPVVMQLKWVRGWEEMAEQRRRGNTKPNREKVKVLQSLKCSRGVCIFRQLPHVSGRSQSSCLAALRRQLWTWRSEVSVIVQCNV